MTTLHAATTLPALADVDVELPHDWLDDREIFLELPGDAGTGDEAAAIGAGGGQRRRVAFIDPRGLGAVSATTIRRAGPAPWPPVPALRPRLAKRRGLTEACATRGVELLFQPFVLPLQPIAFALDLAPLGLRTGQRLLQPRNLSTLLFEQALPVIGTGRASSGHIGVMPYAEKLYKSKLWIGEELRPLTR